MSQSFTSKSILALTLTFFLTLFACPASAAEPEFVRDNLPRKFEGVFNWHGSISYQYVTITLTDVSLDEDNNVIGDGVGRYRTSGDITNIQITFKIKPDTQRLQMRETKPDNPANFVTDGAHLGRISGNLCFIATEWTSKGSGDKGDLFLRAAQ